MVKHKIYLKRRRQNVGEPGVTSLCRRTIKATLQMEGVTVPCEIAVLFTDDAGIAALNLEHRGKNEPTDVLSFPTNTYTPGKFRAKPEDISPQSGCLHLGDIILSDDRVQAQAKEFGHAPTRELAYLMVHSTLHLLGYDHDDIKDKEAMREREEKILRDLGITREL